MDSPNALVYLCHPNLYHLYMETPRDSLENRLSKQHFRTNRNNNRHPTTQNPTLRKDQPGNSSKNPKNNRYLGFKAALAVFQISATACALEMHAHDLHQEIDANYHAAPLRGGLQLYCVPCSVAEICLQNCS